MFFLLGGSLKTMFFFDFMAVSFKVAVNKQVCFYCTSNIGRLVNFYHLFDFFKVKYAVRNRKLGGLTL